MAFKPDQTVTFDPLRVIQPIYTDGSVSLSNDGNILAACVREDVQITNLRTGLSLARIEGDGESITSLAMTPDASLLVICSRSASMRWYALNDLKSGSDSGQAKLIRTLKPHTTPVVTITIDATGSLLATGGADGVIKVWDLRGGYTTHTFHGHSGLVSALQFYRASASQAQLPPRKRKMQQPAVAEEDENSDYRLLSGDEEGKIRVWDMYRRKCLAVLDSHTSIVRSLSYDKTRDLLLSGSRDRTVILHSASTYKPRQIVPIMEAIESVGFLPTGGYFYTGGERGKLRIWQTETGAEVTVDQEAGLDTDAILQAFVMNESHGLLTVHADQVLRFHDTTALQISTSSKIPPLPTIRQISGTHDEVIDLAFVGARADLLALATNLEEIRLISISNTPGAYFGADVTTLKGHSDVVISMSVDWSGCWLATGAKDNTARLWKLDTETASFECYTTFAGHTESVGAIALPSSMPANANAIANPLEHPPSFLLTGSSDTTIKKWDIAKSSAKARWTRKAHDKDINAMAISYSSVASLAASASQDKTVRIWDVESGEGVGVLRGHKRGVWTVAFSPLAIPALVATASGGAASGSRGMVLTGSGDKTVRLWSLTDYTCIRIFEGHVNSVLKTVWLPYDKEAQSSSARVLVASAAGDGLIKVWDAQNGECSATLDNHVDRVWSLAVRPDLAQRNLIDTAQSSSESNPQQPILVSGSADSTMTFWADSTERTAKQATEKATVMIEQDQELQNLVRASNYREAIVLALQLNYPKRLLDLFTAVIDGEAEQGSLTGKHSVDEVLGQLSNSQLWLLLQRCRDWNANTKTYHVAQHIIWTLLHLYTKEQLLKLGPRRNSAVDGPKELSDAMSMLSTQDRRRKAETPKDLLDALKAYTERHDQRLAKLGEERFVLSWAIQSMDGLGMNDLAMVNGT